MNVCFDTETSGLPRARCGYKNTEAYDTCRLVSISWIVSQQDKVVSQAYYIVRPEGFLIGAESEAIHGISQQKATEEGVDFVKVMQEFKEVLEHATHLVAHNIQFDVNVLKSEFHRRNMPDMIALMDQKHEVCTMKKGKEVMRSRTYPKLGNLYKFLYGEEMKNAHNAMYDTYYCFLCYKKMFPADDRLFFFGNRMVRLTDEQTNVVFADKQKHCLVIACAGSGKTTTTLCRIKYLIDQGVPEESIMLTTFTRDAANDMKNKLFDIIGYKPLITVGTLDGISKMFVEKNASASQGHIKDVGEYGSLFLRLVQSKPSLIAKYQYLFVDEYQDINDVQFRLIQSFAANGTKVFAVGDDAQNIYSFRGSKIEYILNFDKHFENTTVFPMTLNFRSTKQIIDLANACIEKNANQIPKVMTPGSAQQVGPKPHVRYFPQSSLQNQVIVQQIKQLLRDNVEAHEIAVLSPFNQSLFLIEELLTKDDVPNVYLDGKADIKTSKKPHHVCLSTIHKAKGLEWDYTFMIQMSDEVIPKNKTESAVDESRRLFYVGITRARIGLYLYYSVLFQQSPYVTRYISELDKSLYTTENMTPECFQGLSELDITPLELSVTKLLENLDGEDYIILKERGILPTLEKQDLNMTKLWQEHTYQPFIVKDDLYSDFGIFMEKYINREVRHACALSNADKHALSCLANVKLDTSTYQIYQQYKNNFKTNLRKVEGLLSNVHANASRLKYLLEQNSKFINAAHMPVLLRVLTEIHTKAQQFHVPPWKIPVFTYSFLPQGFEREMESSLRAYMNGSVPTSDIASTIWELSKCKKIVTEYRRRLLYKKVTQEDLALYHPLLQSIHDIFIPFLLSQGAPTDVDVEEDFEIREGMFGEVDVRVGKLLLDYKCSNSDDVKLQWILQLLCYKVLCDFNQKKIDRIAIFNPMKGWYSELNVATWDKHHELVKYLLDKRDQKSNRP